MLRQQEFSSHPPTPAHYVAAVVCMSSEKIITRYDARHRSQLWSHGNRKASIEFDKKKGGSKKKKKSMVPPTQQDYVQGGGCFPNPLTKGAD